MQIKMLSKALLFVHESFVHTYLKSKFLVALPPRMVITPSDNAKQTKPSSKTLGLIVNNEQVIGVD